MVNILRFGVVNMLRFRVVSLNRFQVVSMSVFSSLVQLILVFSIGFIGLTVPSCDLKRSDSAGGTYVKPTITRTGKFRKGYVRKSVSTNKNAIRNQNRSRYYYQTRGKYRRKLK